jgi:hypothetical protein
MLMLKIRYNSSCFVQLSFMLLLIYVRHNVILVYVQQNAHESLCYIASRESNQCSIGIARVCDDALEVAYSSIASSTA